MAIRSDLLLDGHDPASTAGQLAFLALDNGARARYLKRIEYLESDVRSLLALLRATDRAEVLAYRDDFASEVALQ